MIAEDHPDLRRCATCNTPMAHVGTIRRGLGPDLHLLRCTVCGTTVQELSADRPKLWGAASADWGRSLL